MNTVIAADQLAAGTGFSSTKAGTIYRGQTAHYFFNVPEGSPALKVDMTGGGAAVGAGQIRFLRWSPVGLGIDANAASNCYNPGTCATAIGDQPHDLRPDARRLGRSLLTRAGHPTPTTCRSR